MVTKLVSNTKCDVDLVPAGEYACGESIVVDTWSGDQVFPSLGQDEQCGRLPSGALLPGEADTATLVWDQKTSQSAGGSGDQAAAGRYVAIGSWSWSAGAGQPPYQVAASSASFTLQP